jgi:hypothetical protein
VHQPSVCPQAAAQPLGTDTHTSCLPGSHAKRSPESCTHKHVHKHVREHGHKHVHEHVCALCQRLFRDAPALALHVRRSAMHKANVMSALGANS